jgi:hypothetical protein
MSLLPRILQVGERIEIPMYYDMWMRGARFGVVTSIRRNRPGLSDAAYVKMDHPQVKRRVKVWRMDWADCK